MKFLNDIKKANNSILDVKKLGFEITNTDLPLEVGETKYDPDAQTLVTRITENDVLRHGQMEIIRVRNNTGSQIPKGTAVYVTGGIANSPILLVAPANNNQATEARRFIGLTTTDIPNNSFGKVITSGVIEGLNLPSSEWTVGECAYITTNGEYTNDIPEKGLLTIRVGMVIRVGNNTGAILVFSRFQPFLGMLSDVAISDPQSGNTLVYDNEFGIWVNANPEISAENVSYDNTTSGALNEDVQLVIDELFFIFGLLGLVIDPETSNAIYEITIDGGVSSIQFQNQLNGGES